jgi:hypothetical protein
MTTTQIDEVLNRISDWDNGWWPLLVLRPRREQRFSTGRVLLLSLIYGSAGAALALILATILFGIQPMINVIGAFPFMYVVCFAGYWFSFAAAWNRRAAALASAAREPDPPALRNP